MNLMTSILSRIDLISMFRVRHTFSGLVRMKAFMLCFSFFLLISCGAGYHRVRYAEMPIPPNVTLKDNELIVTTRNEDGKGLSVYKVDIDIRDRAHVIDLRGYQALGKPEKTAFTITLSESQLREIRNYRIYWIDLGGRKTQVHVTTP